MQKTHAIELRWTPRLGKKFCGVSSYFLANYYRLKLAENGRCINSTEAMLIVQLHDFKWDARAPYPTVGTLATRMGLSTRGVRNALQVLEEAGYILRVPDTSSGPNRYHFDGLYKALEALMGIDAEANEAASAGPQAPPQQPAVWVTTPAVKAA